ncbi:MAG: CDC48 family AAA ATPase [Chloroflexi bacterium]|nr:CDC48 family AAA ATPase [Chloroflexota bacterium]
MSETAEKVQNLTLRVAEAAARDAGRTVARIDPSDMKLLSLNVGDVVEIKGTRSTGAKVMPAFAPERGKRLILIDGLIRANCGASLNGTVQVRKMITSPAKSLLLTPMTEGSVVGGNSNHQMYLKRSLEGAVVKTGDLVRVSFLGSGFQEFMVQDSSPSVGLLVIGPSTVLKFNTPQEDARTRSDRRTGSGVTYEDIGGLSRQLARIRELIELPLRYPEVFDRLGIEPPKGVLLYGPPGSGKTLIARAVANETSAYFISVSGPEIIHKFYGESEANLRKIFQEAANRAPSIIFLDEIDSLAPRREQVQGDVEKRVVGQLLTLLDGLRGRGRVVVIGATNLPNNLDPALRRPGRFDREITIGVPDRPGREEILTIYMRSMPLTSDVDISRLAAITHGFVGADLAALCREAALSALRRAIPDLELDTSAISYEQFMNLSVCMDDFISALKEIEPSAIREVYTEVPDVSWDKIGGLEDVKQILREAVQWPLAYPKLFERSGTTATRGVLLYGPPGCGKTMVAQALASESEVNFISIKGPELLSKWVGESEKGVREIFKKARQAAPCIVFFDELDAIAPIRGARSNDGVSDRVVAQLLTEMDGIESAKGVMLLAATNRPEMVDPALLRPGRFDVKVRLGRPNAEARRQILEVHTINKPLADLTIIDRLVPRTKGLVGADLALLCNRAALNSVRRAVTQVEEGTQALAAAEAALDAGITEFAGARGGLETVGELEQRLNDVTPLLLEEDFEEALTAILANRKPRGDKERGGLPTPPPL